MKPPVPLASSVPPEFCTVPLTTAMPLTSVSTSAPAPIVPPLMRAKPPLCIAVCPVKLPDDTMRTPPLLTVVSLALAPISTTCEPPLKIRVPLTSPESNCVPPKIWTPNAAPPTSTTCVPPALMVVLTALPFTTSW